ncbi:MAG: 2-phosphosulfolactate phosphatase [Verrucomicrobiota bacterium]
MTDKLTVLHSPAQWRTLSPAQLHGQTAVVIDVIRATSTIAAALAQGAAGVRPVAALEDAFALKAQHPEAILAGERGGKPLEGFDFGNSPEDFTRKRVNKRLVILTTTNGTQALAACAGAKAVIAASLLNLDAVAARLRELGPPWLIVCAGCNGHFGVDDAIVAGALAETLDCDHAFVHLYRSVRGNLVETLVGCDAGRELVKVGMEKDIPYCATISRLTVVPTLGEDGVLRRLDKGRGDEGE